MPQDLTSELTNLQDIELKVEGPDGANRLFICAGEMQSDLSAPLESTMCFLIGPKLGRREFVRATCIVAPRGLLISYPQAFPMNSVECYIRSAQADWDDEAQQVQVTFDIRTGGRMNYKGLQYQVMILAEVA